MGVEECCEECECEEKGFCENCDCECCLDSKVLSCEDIETLTKAIENTEARNDK